uniref:Very-long-chain (3R)-3-hydroxyacyl-CoA dehydratase n=1 Tax=Ditylenchus dipsaci TaxID=166011 RepID=A0A915DBZ5_9BILA
MKGTDIYLIFYNAVQVLGWGSILVKTVLGLVSGSSNVQLYENVEWELQIFQTAAILEIVHTAVGLVRSPLGTTITQVFSRVTVVWLILFKVVSSRASIGVPMLLVACSSLFAHLDAIHFFIALYPLGASGEVITMIAALPEIGQKKHWTLEMPNGLNFAFSFYCFVIFLCLVYLPGFPQLYGYMFVQRKKVLSTNKTKKVA